MKDNDFGVSHTEQLDACFMRVPRTFWMTPKQIYTYQHVLMGVGEGGWEGGSGVQTFLL